MNGMKGSIRVSAKTLDDAITEALIQLGVTSDRLEYNVIEKGSAGFLGIGMKQAVIEAWKKEDKEEEEFLKAVEETIRENPVKEYFAKEDNVKEDDVKDNYVCVGYLSLFHDSVFSSSSVNIPISGRIARASRSLSVSTSLSLRWMARVRVPKTSSICPLAVCKFFWAFSSIPPTFSNSFFTAPKIVHTSPECFWIANVRKPICKLFSMAARVVGPVTTTL